jgi:trk system potassium uptake protein TrkA
MAERGDRSRATRGVWRFGAGRDASPERDNIVIVGGGLVGATLAERLARDAHDVTLVENDRARVEELNDRLEDVRILEGNGTTAPVLRDAGVEKASLVVAVTNSEAANLVIGFLAASFQVPRLIARIQDPDHQRCIDFLKSVGQPEYETVNPNQVAAGRIAALLSVPGASDVVSFLEHELLLVGFRISQQSDFANLLVRNIDLMFAGTTALVGAIRRGPEWIIPRGDDELRVDDVAYFAVTRQELPGVLSLIGVAPQQRGRHLVLVAGATPVGLELASRLEKEPAARGNGLDLSAEWRVTLIEEDRSLAERADERLGTSLVVHGQATDQRLLEEEEIEHAAAFVAATGDHETNLAAALLAKRLGAQRAFALVDNPAIANLVAEIGVDAPIVPRQLVIDTVLGYVRGKRVLSVATLLQEGMEAFEGEVAPGSILCSGPIRDVADRIRGALIVCVQRNGKLQVPRGDFEIHPGDHAVLITTKEHAESLGKQLSS